ncbi:MAG: CYTH domain-containing protein [Verrucomicrobiota bacterium]
MAIEIERRFLVAGEFPRDNGATVRQGFLSVDPDRTVRVRISGEKAWLTIKSRGEGIARLEFEYEIPASDASQLLDLTVGHKIDKTRYLVPFEGHTWEVDEFHGANDGLVIAELELDSEAERFARPPWLGAEITDDLRYTNSTLADNPYSNWK